MPVKPQSADSLLLVIRKVVHRTARDTAEYWKASAIHQVGSDYAMELKYTHLRIQFTLCDQHELICDLTHRPADAVWFARRA